jgi:hypothetical protein
VGVVLLVLLLVVALAAGLLWTQRRQITAMLLAAAAEARGIHGLELEVVAVDPGGLRVADVRWPPLLAMEALEVASHPSGLLRGRVDGVVIDGLSVTIEGGEQLTTLRRALGVGEARSVASGGSDGAWVLPAAVPDRVGLHDARVTATVGAISLDLRLDTDLVRAGGIGPWRGDLQAELLADPIQLTARLLASAGTSRIGGQGPVELAIDGSLLPFGLDAQLDRFQSEGHLVLLADAGVPGAWLEMDAAPVAGRLYGNDVIGTLPALSVELEPGEEEPFTVEARGGALRRSDEPGRVEELAIDLAGTLEAFTGQASARLRDLVVGDTRVPPTHARADFTRTAERDRVTLRLQPEEKEAALRIEAVRAAGSDTVVFSAQPFELGPSGVDLVALAPGLLPGIERLGGRAEAVRGQLDTRGGKLRFDLVLAGVDAATGAGTATGIDGTVAVTGPSPWRTDGPQTLRVASVQAGLPFEQGRLVFELEPEGMLRVDAFDLRVAGGDARAEHPFHLDPDDTRVAFGVSGIDLALLLEAIAVEGLTGEGQLRGRLPFEWNGETGRLRNGLLEATGPGVLSYRSNGSVASIPAAGNDLGVLIEVLEDFRYDVLRIEASGDLLGTVQLVLHTEGHNPTFQDGRPIDFTLNLEAPFKDLLGSTRWLTAPPENLDELLRQLPPAPGMPSREGDG